jgi:hypothetical protein
MEDPSPLALLSAALAPIPFSKNFQVCAIAAEGLATTYWNEQQEDKELLVPQKDHEQEFGNYIQQLKQLQLLDCNHKEEGSIKVWTMYQVAKKQLYIAAKTCKIQQEKFKKQSSTTKQQVSVKPADNLKLRSAFSQQIQLQYKVGQLNLKFGLHQS